MFFNHEGTGDAGIGAITLGDEEILLTTVCGTLWWQSQHAFPSPLWVCVNPIIPLFTNSVLS